MDRKWWLRCFFLLGTVALSAAYLYPTLARIDTEKHWFPIKSKINLGLDLQGGLYMVLGVEFEKVFAEVIARQSVGLGARLKEKQLHPGASEVVRVGQDAEDPKIRLGLANPAEHDGVVNLIKTEYTMLRITQDKPDLLELGLAHEYKRDVREKTIGQSIEVIRNRIDEFGVTEPTIASQGTDRVVIELPGVRDVERAKRLIGQTAKLEFRMANDKGEASLPGGSVGALIAQLEQEKGISYKDGEKFSDYVERINEAAKGKIPSDSVIAFERDKTARSEGAPARRPILLFSKTEVTGDELQDAQVGFDPETRRPEVEFNFNPRGAAIFEKVTGENVGHRLAIVLDDNVITAPTIQSKIGSRGRITLGQGSHDDMVREAKDLAIQLRAGALPAQLEFLEERVVGPSLGQDSIYKGSLAGVIGSLAVFLFMMLYYKKSGAIAVVSLLLNVLYVVAILVGLEATLTLPGIAGIALTVGIAVDSNVVIYERIREEIRAAKSLVGSVESGFQKAFRTILDANVTNACAAVILMVYGTGPIKGFAVTMMIGIVTTLFTAVFVCKLMFDFYLKRLEGRPATDLSI